MSSPRFAHVFKDEAVRQIVDRGYFVAEESERLGVSGHSLSKWAAALVEAKVEVLKLCAQLRRTEEERDVLKKAAR